MESVEETISKEEVSKLLSIIRTHTHVGEILEGIHPGLRTLYDNRRIHYNQDHSLFKIPREKLNNEERLLFACFCDTNLKEDMNELLEYCAKMLDILVKANYHKREIIMDNQEEVIKLVFNNAIRNYYSSKIKLFFKDIEDEEEENRKIEEARKNK
jgi:hypothetical protein